MNEIKRICEHCKKEFSITEIEQSLTEKIGLELSIACSDCLLRQHFSFWLFRKISQN
jgi:DNA-directed RNA polymerase subunit RPC12/RpoP